MDAQQIIDDQNAEVAQIEALIGYFDGCEPSPERIRAALKLAYNRGYSHAIDAVLSLPGMSAPAVTPCGAGTPGAGEGSAPFSR